MSDTATPTGAAPPVTPTVTAPSAPAVAPTTTTAPPTDGRPRDEKGRFAPTNAEGQPPELAPEGPPKKFYKVKDGEEELEVDEDEVVRGYQRARAANKRFEEAARLRQEIQAERDRLNRQLHAAKTNPAKALELLGVDPRAWMEAELKRLVEEEALPEHERHRRQLEAERAQFEEERRRWQEAQAKAQHQAQVDAHTKQFMQAIPEALKSAGLPQRGVAATRLIDMAQAMLQNGVQPDFNALAREVRSELEEDHRQLLGGLDDDGLRKWVGEERLTKLRLADLEKLRGTPPVPAPPPEAPKAAPEPPPRRPRWDDWTPEDDVRFRLK